MRRIWFYHKIVLLNVGLWALKGGGTFAWICARNWAIKIVESSHLRENIRNVKWKIIAYTLKKKNHVKTINHVNLSQITNYICRIWDDKSAFSASFFLPSQIYVRVERCVVHTDVNCSAFWYSAMPASLSMRKRHASVKMTKMNRTIYSNGAVLVLVFF